MSEKLSDEELKEIISIPKDYQERFWERVNKTDYCWEWQGHTNSKGYGTISMHGRHFTTHRFSFAIFHGFLPSCKMDIMHICDNKKCVNPKHLKIGTRSENTKDYFSKNPIPWSTGERNNKAKITDLQYTEIKKLLNSGKSKTSAAKMFGITVQSLSGRIKREKARIDRGINSLPPAPERGE